jgi:hypothetical protein
VFHNKKKAEGKRLSGGFFPLSKSVTQRFKLG